MHDPSQQPGARAEHAERSHRRASGLRERAIDRIEPGALSTAGPKATDEIFAELSRDRDAAVGKTLAYLQGKGSAEELLRAARRLVLLKGADSHDYKFSRAVFDDFYSISPEWRSLCLAACVLQLKGAGERDNPLVGRARAALER